MKQVSDNGINILYVETNEIKLLDIPRVLDEMGYHVFRATFEMKIQGFEQKVCRKITAAIDNFVIHCVISYDFIPTIAEACMETGIPYIAWVYDAPQKELYTHYALYPCNYIFAFDKEQVCRLQNIGIRQVYHMPLAVHVNKINMVLETMEKNREFRYVDDISFIGQLYKVENEDVLFAHMDKKIVDELSSNIDDCFMKWNKNIRMHGLMSEKCIQYFEELENHKVKKMYPYMEEGFYYEAAFLSRVVANRERVAILNGLAEKYNVHLYTNDTNTTQLSKHVKVSDGLSYDVLTKIYKESKINLNITLHCIETGIPQRVFDIMAAGGFLLTNYQEEIEEFFVPGEDLVVYHDEQELMELVAYYLEHEGERERIAQNGQTKVLANHGYHIKLKKAFEVVMNAEKDREETYIILQSKELRKQANDLLAQKNQQAYEKLFHLIADKKYEVVIEKFTDLEILHEMVRCWNKEKKMGIQCIFEDIESLEQAENKYNKLKHGLWRIEQGLSYNSCKDAIDFMRKNAVSKFFIAWIISSKLQDREETLIKLADLFAKENILEAIELLSYGIFLVGEDEQLLLQKANYYMELNLWTEALQTLIRIDQPDLEICEIINELSNILGYECRKYE